MERRKIANEAEARRALSAVAGAKVSIGAWARAHGIDGRSLHAWDLALNRKARPKPVAQKKPTAGLVELVSTAVAASQARYVMRVGAVSFEFGDDAQEETLRRAVGVLRSC